ncbi:hypothetical protein BDN67DRAFT_500923 [Paxillus ammoniavirescens]|nr:hypothetical protein BDN67DRAFT_500923 [Paxillus ammoniavirescens]
MLTLATRRASSALAGRAALLRAYTTGGAGSVAQSKEFGKKERAHEDEYARRHEAELLRKLKAETLQIEAKKKELAELESKVKDSESK